MLVIHRDVIRKEVISNLLDAQKQIAKNGNAMDNIRIAKYLLKISEDFTQQINYIVPAENENNPDYPPDKG